MVADNHILDSHILVFFDIVFFSSLTSSDSVTVFQTIYNACQFPQSKSHQLQLLI